MFTICGTKVFPAPSVADILMDMYANSVPFHNGVAHQGMVAATNNILARAMDPLAVKMAALPGYKLVILGYSLGAGVAQLVTLRSVKPHVVPRARQGVAPRAGSGSPFGQLI